MMRFLAFTIALLIACAIPLISNAGDKKMPGPEHKVLEKMVGTWDAKVKFYLEPNKPMESKGVMTRTMILEGNYLQESFKGEFIGKPFAGLGLIGFNAVTKKYETVWCDSMAKAMSHMQGTYDKEKKTFTSIGEDYDPNTKKKMKARDVLKFVSADEQYFEMFRQPEGEEKEYRVMEITYTRAIPKKQPADKKPDGETEAKVKQLQRERHEALTEAAKLLRQRFQNRRISVHEVMRLQLAVTESALELCDTPMERVETLRNGLKVAEQLHTITAAFAKTGQGSQDEALQSRAVVLDLQIRLLREEAKGK